MGLGGKPNQKLHAALAVIAVATLILQSCTSTNSYAGIPLRPGLAQTELQDLARRAKAGDKYAQLELGIRFEEGVGVKPDLDRAAKMYRSASKMSGGIIYAYNRGAKGELGSLNRIDNGPVRGGLPEASERLARLRTREGGSREQFQNHKSENAP